MNWIRIATRMKTDPKVGMVAMHCGVPIAHAVGMVCCTLMEFPEHAPNGEIAAVPDVVLEDWAGWRGDGGEFAAVFRAQFCDPDGTVESWERHNGKALRKARADMDRKRAARERRENGAETARAKPRNGAQTAPKRRADSEVDETRRNGTTAAPIGAAVVSGGAADWVPLHFPDPDHQQAATGYLRAHQFPDAMRATLTAIASGHQGPNGQPVPWPTIGHALVEMQGAGARFTPNALRAFVAKLQQPTPSTAEVTWDDVIRAANAPEVSDVA